MAQSNRLAQMDSLGREELMTITEDDVQKAREADDKLNKLLRQREEQEASAREAIIELEQLAAEIEARNTQK